MNADIAKLEPTDRSMPPTATTIRSASTTSPPSAAYWVRLLRLVAVTYPLVPTTTPSTMAMKAMNGIALSTQPFDRTSDNIRRCESTKRGTRWRGRRAKSIGTDNV